MKILEYGTKGMGRVIEDRTAQIIAMNKAPAVIPPSTAGTGGTKTANGGAGGSAGTRSRDDAGTQPPSDDHPEVKHVSSGCTVASSGGGGSLAWLLLACAALLRRRARASAARA